MNHSKTAEEKKRLQRFQRISTGQWLTAKATRAQLTDTDLDSGAGVQVPAISQQHVKTVQSTHRRDAFFQQQKGIYFMLSFITIC